MPVQARENLQEQSKAGLYMGSHIGDTHRAGSNGRAKTATGSAAVGAGAHALAAAGAAPAHTGRAAAGPQPAGRCGGLAHPAAGYSRPPGARKVLGVPQVSTGVLTLQAQAVLKMSSAALVHRLLCACIKTASQATPSYP